MNTAETYEKVFFYDNYKDQFEAFRNHYRARTRKALQGRKIDHTPEPNIDAIVFLHDDSDGNTYVTTGDFVEYFNRRFGDNDRIGAARRSLAYAARKAESAPEIDRKRAAAVKASEEKPFVTRSAKPKFAFLQTIFAMLLLFAVCLWGGSVLYLNNSESYMMEVEERGAALEVRYEDSSELYLSDGLTEKSVENAAFMNMGAADRVELEPFAKS